MKIDNENHSMRVIGDYEGLSLSKMELLSLCFHSLAKIASSLDYPEVVSETLENSALSFQKFKAEIESKRLPSANVRYANAGR